VKLPILIGYLILVAVAGFKRGWRGEPEPTDRPRPRGYRPQWNRPEEILPPEGPA
jgi:hypothetical protein